jgi:hypothetical protein
MAMPMPQPISRTQFAKNAVAAYGRRHPDFPPNLISEVASYIVDSYFVGERAWDKVLQAKEPEMQLHTRERLNQAKKTIIAALEAVPGVADWASIEPAKFPTVAETLFQHHIITHGTRGFPWAC